MTGNRGEWSEIYVFLKLLSDGKLHAADASLNMIRGVYYPIIKIIRQEYDRKLEYSIDKNSESIKITDSITKEEISQFPITEFAEQAKRLLEKIIHSSGSAFEIPEIEKFLKEINIYTLIAAKTEKTDIKIVVHDFYTGLQVELGFSIKSLLGMNSTLFNPGNTTNFIYEVMGPGSIDISEINSIETTPKIASRIAEIRRRGYKIVFEKIQSDTFQQNLQLIDSNLPSIISELLLIKYSTPGTASLSKTLDQLTKNNPLGYNLLQGHPFYEYKIKNFLTDSALGMTPSGIWTGKYNATGGIIIVKGNGEVVCYHIYNRNEFQDYLLNNTRLEQASTTRYGFGSLYEEKGKTYLKLNLQVRFN
ncbi:MAG: HpaII family restriction endonuclease [Treponema sp.]|nr:HpaII family restriction endonuclease [Treponema sp.]